MTPAISVAGLTRRYRGQLVLDDVTFDVQGASITGLLGGNGAGNPVTELRHSLLVRQAGCCSPGQRPSSRTRGLAVTLRASPARLPS